MITVVKNAPYLEAQFIIEVASGIPTLITTFNNTGINYTIDAISTHRLRITLDKSITTILPIVTNGWDIADDPVIIGTCFQRDSTNVDIKHTTSTHISRMQLNLKLIL